MLRVGVTGGIGSGKSTVCRIFAALGIPIYDSDRRAKALMNDDPTLVARITELLGAEAYRNGRLDRAYVAGRVFGDRGLLEKLNAIVHPAVGADFTDWAEAQERCGVPYALLESAILFESGFDGCVDRTVTVSAPLEIRVARTVARDGVDEAQVRARIANQADDAWRESLAAYTVVNDGRSSLMEQVFRLDKVFRDEGRR